MILGLSHHPSCRSFCGTFSSTIAEPGRGTRANLFLYLLAATENSQPGKQEYFLRVQLKLSGLKNCKDTSLACSVLQVRTDSGRQGPNFPCWYYVMRFNCKLRLVLLH